MILLAGGDAALLEGLAQALTPTGHRVAVAHSLDEAEELRAGHAPILTVMEREMVSTSERAQAFLRSALAAGSAVVTYRGAGDTSRAVAAGFARHILADLVLPLERNRLVALAEHLSTRARAVGRNRDVTPPETPAS